MARAPKPSAFSSKTAKGKTGPKSPRPSQIPEAVSRRMARRIGLATGLPTLLGMLVFVGSYFLVSRRLIDIPPVVTLGLSGGFFSSWLSWAELWRALSKLGRRTWQHAGH